jgi:hypothetical protein
MWAAIIIIVVALLLVLAAPKPKVENARAASLGDFNFPRSKEGDPVPWFLGTVRLMSPNTLWNGDFNPVPIKKKQKTGLFSSKKVTVGYKYHIGLDLCWALGGSQTIRLRRIWSDKHVFWSGNINTAQTLNINSPNLFGGEEQRGGVVGSIDFYPGSFNETRNAYLADKADPEVPAYIGQCRMVFRGSANTKASGFYFGTTTNINTISAEMSRLSTKVHATYSIMPNGLDVNPMEMMYAGFSERFGMPGVSTDDIDLPSWQRDAETLYNEGFGMSLLIQTSITGKDLAEEALRIADGILYQDSDTGKIVSKLIRQDYDVETLPIIDQTIVRELVSFSKTTWDQTYNQCRVVFKDRSQDYSERAAVQQDFANINFQQRVKNTDISVPGCFVNEEASNLAVRQLSLLSVPLFQIEIRCNRKASGYKPGDVFKFNWAPYGITNMVMRVQKIDKGTLTDGIVTINAVQDRFATALAVFAPPSGSDWVDPIGDPQPMNPEGLFELPFEMSTAEGAIIATLGSRLQSADMGYVIYAGSASGDVNLTEQGQEDAFTPSGVLSAPYSFSTAARDPVGFALGSVLQSEEIEGVSEDELLSGASVALIRSAAGDELVAFKEFDGGQVEDVIRGIFGTVPLTHPAGATVFFISSGYGLANEDAPLTVIPQTLYAKLLTFNPRGQLELSAASQRSVAVVNKAGRPAVPGKVRVNGATIGSLGTVVGPFNLAWAHRNRFDTEVRTQDDASVTPEESTRYNIRIYRQVAGTLLVQGLLGDASNAAIRLNFTGLIRIELEATDGTLTSYTKHSYVVDYDAAGGVVNEIIFDTTTIIFDGGGA